MSTTQQNQTCNQTDASLLPEGQDRSEQMEYFQSYEMSAKTTEDDVNQATLQKEFPQIDSSLIAALYNDSKDMGGTREALTELASSA
jgi:hypothetical protein